ncbi:MAG: peptidase E [Planctomycetota bacterium]|nr:peptidase E [Planctomycetota bacterium]MDA1141835.1 peptidase E [Planctomycetota bacterium]
MPKTIIAIGGGSMLEFQTLKIDRTVVKRTGKKNPKALFIPTASTDSEVYCGAFHATYRDRLKCKTDELLLLRDRPSLNVIRRKIKDADLIYVGGGNTLMMMKLWRRLGVNKMLEQAWRRGTVMAGLSAGMLCWFSHGHSDSMSFYNPDEWDYIRVKCLGLIPALGCPHYDGEKRDQSFEAMVKKTGDIGIAVDNNCAVEFVDDGYRVLTSADGAGAYKVCRRRGKIFSEQLPQKTTLLPLSTLLEM